MHEVERVAVEHLVELLGLGSVRGKPSSTKPSSSGPPGARRSSTTPIDDLVGDELAGVHVALGLEPERGAQRDRGAEHVAGRQVRDAVVLRERAACVPLPAPCLPSSTRRGPEAAHAQAQEPFVVAHHQLAVDLLHRLERDAHGDEDRRAAEGELADVPELEHEQRSDRDRSSRNSEPGSVMRLSTLAR